MSNQAVDRLFAPSGSQRIVVVGATGSGKTTFVQGLADGLGVRTPCTSPSFTLMHAYEGRYPMLHVDLFRLERVQELADLGLEELLEPPWVVAIEWGEKAGPLVTDDYLEIELSWTEDDEDVRILKLRPYGRWRLRMGELTEAVRSWSKGVA
jgi:tRNA threonylcarbamoyl adenosine modification protein YjeE